MAPVRAQNTVGIVLVLLRDVEIWGLELQCLQEIKQFQPFNVQYLEDLEKLTTTCEYKALISLRIMTIAPFVDSLIKTYTQIGIIARYFITRSRLSHQRNRHLLNRILRPKPLYK
jgi:hypothetical protein